MCNKFVCSICLLTFYDHCSTIDLEPPKDCPDTTILPDGIKCNTCQTLQDVTSKLETKGASGLDDLSSWERQDAEKILYKDRGSDITGSWWADKAESREERQKNAEKIAEMGLDGMQDAREEHQGFAMDLTPENS